MSGLPVPPGGAVWDEGAGMPVVRVEGRAWRTVWIAAQHAADLAADGRPAALDRAARVIGALAACQDGDPGSPHRGNFPWEREDPVVEDLNAAPFVAIRLIPMLLRHGDRLAPAARETARRVCRGALEAIARLDVRPEYTNIAAQSFAALMLGGQLLGDAALTALGRRRFADWRALVDESGLAHEYNSPAYAHVTASALSALADLSEDPAAARAARIMRARLLLSLALRVAPGDGRLAGPWCRAYWPWIAGAGASARAQIDGWIAAGVAPDWLGDAADAAGGAVVETSDRRRGVTLTTRHGPGWSLGAASRDLDLQNIRFIAGQSAPLTVSAAGAVMLTRYVLNDRWLGDFRTIESRPSDQVFLDQGAWRGIEADGVVVGAYAPRGLGGWARVSAAAACVVWSEAAATGDLRIDGAPVNTLPAAVPDGAVVTVVMGPVAVAARPLLRTRLGPAAPALLRRRGGMLVLEMVNYRGPAKTFWEHARPSAFARRPCVASLAVAAAVDAAAAAAKLDGLGVSWGDDDDALRIAQPGGPLDGAVLRFEGPPDPRLSAAPMLRAAVAAQDRSGAIDIGGASLRCAPSPAWLLSLPAARCWVAACHGPARGDVTLRTPEGALTIPDAREALVEWRRDRVRVATDGGPPRLESRSARLADDGAAPEGRT